MITYRHTGFILKYFMIAFVFSVAKALQRIQFQRYYLTFFSCILFLNWSTQFNWHLTAEYK